MNFDEKTSRSTFYLFHHLPDQIPIRGLLSSQGDSRSNYLTKSVLSVNFEEETSTFHLFYHLPIRGLLYHQRGYTNNYPSKRTYTNLNKNYPRRRSFLLLPRYPHYNNFLLSVHHQKKITLPCCYYLMVGCGIGFALCNVRMRRQLGCRWLYVCC